MQAVAALCCAVAFVHPMSDRAPTELNGVLAVALTGSVVWLLVAREVGDRVLHALVGCGVLVNTALVALAATPQGSTVAGLTYTWLTLYGAYYFSRRSARVLTGVNALAYAAALLVNPFPGAATAWAVVTNTAVFGGERRSGLLQQLRDDARRDRLTGVLNRTGLEQAGQRRLAEAERSGAPLSVAVIDLDGFKQVNDAHGHAAGDRLLVELTGGWRDELRGEDVLARSGGDEFVLLLAGTDRAQAQEVLDRLRSGSPSAWSYGLALREPGEDLERCLARADRDLYRAKSLRRGLSVVPAQRQDGAVALTRT
jgi:diguanylate cyclase (GGDEF)-like protein